MTAKTRSFSAWSSLSIGISVFGRNSCVAGTNVPVSSSSINPCLVLTSREVISFSIWFAV